jgi:hypothetical protein
MSARGRHTLCCRNCCRTSVVPHSVACCEWRYRAGTLAILLAQRKSSRVLGELDKCFASCWVASPKILRSFITKCEFYCHPLAQPFYERRRGKGGLSYSSSVSVRKIVECEIESRGFNQPSVDECELCRPIGNYLLSFRRLSSINHPSSVVV